MMIFHDIKAYANVDNNTGLMASVISKLLTLKISSKPLSCYMPMKRSFTAMSATKALPIDPKPLRCSCGLPHPQG